MVTETYNGTPGLGPLAAALAKAQSEFGAVTRNKTVTVQLKTGRSYTFAYAPLDHILEVVRAPLAKNGLALVQLLDVNGLVTMLVHDSGAFLEGRTPLPSPTDIQAYGSAVTYLRRYAIQALLGIAAEEDDDANRAAGNQATPRDEQGAAEARTTHVDGLVGKAIAQGTQDFELRQHPDKGLTLPFRLKEGRLNQIVLAQGELALQLADVKDQALDQRITVWGHYKTEEFPKKDGSVVTYNVLFAERIKVPDGRVLPVVSPLRRPALDVTIGPDVDDLPHDTIPVAEGQESFDLVESARLDAEEAAAAG